MTDSDTPAPSNVLRTAPNRTHAWARAMIDECVRSGTSMFFISPGSRSTPLTTAVAQHPKARAILHLDERGGAFAAIGYARVTGRPAGWITTSGTAVANGMPAVVEAAQEGIPLLLLTADRPPERRNTGANQTIDQVKLFGDHVCWSADVPPPDAEVPLASVLTTVDQALHHAQRPPGGPVHLNVMYRKPLHPVEQEAYEITDPAVEAWSQRRTPFTTYPVPVPHATVPETLIDAVQQAERGLIVAGRLSDADAKELLEWAQAQHWPVLPDITSQLRLAADSPVVPYAHHIIQDAPNPEALHPDVILQVGGRFVSKPMRHLIRDANASVHATLRPAPLRVDPDHRCTHHIETTIEAAIDALPTRTATPASWNGQWQRYNEAVESAFDAPPEGMPAVHEPGIAWAISEHIPDTHAWMLASSMPIRDAQRYAVASGPAVPVVANRGASGIDGTLATAAGISAARNAPTTLLIGDLATWHDVNALALLQAHPVIAVVINNDGGGIFHFLPIAEHDDVFDPYFTTPQGRSFDAIADAFDLPYARPTTLSEFTHAYQNACDRGTSALIEVSTDRSTNADVHHQLDAHVAQALAEAA